jgi:dolichol-phosphate mannosyltransferase
MNEKYIAVIPTYNEAANLEILLPKLLELGIEVLVVDDASPDGTADIARSISKQISVLERSSKKGLGSAYLEGFEIALNEGFEYIIQMDADGSHRVEDLKKLMKEAPSADLIIGSRWIPGGRIQNWSKSREYLSRVANQYSKTLLKSPVNDMTAGFRIYKSSLLKKMNLKAIKSQGYGFQIEMTREAEKVGAVIREVPILFVEREIGTSKMTAGIVLEAILKVTLWGLRSGEHKSVE